MTKDTLPSPVTLSTPDIEKLRELASEMLAALTALYEACERRANEEGGDFGDDIGPAAELADAAIAKAEDARREAEIRDDFAAAPASWRVPTLLRLLDTERARITALEGERDALIHDLGRSMEIATSECNRAEAAEGERDTATRALRYFMEDPRFQVSVGGNPIAVDRMLAEVRAILAAISKTEGKG